MFVIRIVRNYFIPAFDQSIDILQVHILLILQVQVISANKMMMVMMIEHHCKKLKKKMQLIWIPEWHCSKLLHTAGAQTKGQSEEFSQSCNIWCDTFLFGKLWKNNLSTTKGSSKYSTNVNFQTVVHVTANTCNNTLNDNTRNNPTEVVKLYSEHTNNGKLKSCHKEIALDCYGEFILRKAR